MPSIARSHPRPTPRLSAQRAQHPGFTLIELLAVLAIISILAAILIPTAGAVRTTAFRAKTRVQYSQWAAAIEAFRQEYGYYPVFDASNKVNGGATIVAAELHYFHDTLAGQRRNGDNLPEHETGVSAALLSPAEQNSHRVRFIDFTEGEIFPGSHPDAAKRGLLHDAFDNTDIAVLVDRNLDGVINEADYPALPGVSPPERPALTLTPSVDDFPPGPSGGVRAGVLIYSAPPKTAESSQLIMNWK